MSRYTEDVNYKDLSYFLTQTKLELEACCDKLENNIGEGYKGEIMLKTAAKLLEQYAQNVLNIYRKNVDRNNDNNS